MTSDMDRTPVARSRGQKVVIELTANQADTLWWLLRGQIDRCQFQPRTMRTLKQIIKRVEENAARVERAADKNTFAIRREAEGLPYQGVSEHPVGYDGPCGCDDCCSA